MLMVTCPANAQAGTQIMFPTPQGQQIMVAVPAGVVAGQMFQVQLPAAPAAVAGSPEQVLEASIAAAGGSLHLENRSGGRGLKWPFLFLTLLVRKLQL